MAEPDSLCAPWHKSSRSTNADGCVEVAVVDSSVFLRDSKDHSGPVLSMDSEDWAAFLVAVREGAFDPPGG